MAARGRSEEYVGVINLKLLYPNKRRHNNFSSHEHVSGAPLNCGWKCNCMITINVSYYKMATRWTRHQFCANACHHDPVFITRYRTSPGHGLNFLGIWKRFANPAPHPVTWHGSYLTGNIGCALTRACVLYDHPILYVRWFAIPDLPSNSNSDDVSDNILLHFS